MHVFTCQPRCTNAGAYLTKYYFLFAAHRMRLLALQQASDVFGKEALTKIQKKELANSSMALYSKPWVRKNENDHDDSDVGRSDDDEDSDDVEEE